MKRQNLTFPYISIDGRCNTVELMGIPIRLTTHEFEILFLLASSFGKTLSAREIYSSIWQMTDLGNVYTVCVHVSNLRKKLTKACPERSFIITKWKEGYQFVANCEEIESLSSNDEKSRLCTKEDEPIKTNTKHLEKEVITMAEQARQREDTPLSVPNAEGNIWPRQVCPAFVPRDDTPVGLRQCWYCRCADFHLKRAKALEVGVCYWPKKIIE